MKLGSVFEAHIERSTHDGHGIFSAEGRTLFVPGGTPGDRMRVRVEHLSPHRPEGWCSVLEIDERGTEFTKPPCPHAWPTEGGCGGCPLMHLSDAAYFRVKGDWVNRELSRAALELPIGLHRAPSRLGYRNRCNFVVSKEADESLVFGSYAQRSNRVVSMRGCPALREPLAEVAEGIRRLLESRQVPVYPEPGGLRYVTVRHFNTGGVFVDLVVRSVERGWLDPVGEELAALFEVRGVSFSVNDSPGNAIRVAGSQLLAGQATGTERIGSRELRLASSSFAQLNTEVTEQMYRRAATAVTDGDTIWDLYCGAGGLGLCATAAAERVRIFGAESVEGAVALARVNAAECGVVAEYETIDLSAPALDRWPRPDVVLVNPPRRGLHDGVRALLTQIAASRIVYMSCSATSFAADAEHLSKAGWRLKSLDGWDMLPQTSHMELLGVFERAR